MLGAHTKDKSLCEFGAKVSRTSMHDVQGEDGEDLLGAAAGDTGYLTSVVAKAAAVCGSSIWLHRARLMPVAGRKAALIPGSERQRAACSWRGGVHDRWGTAAFVDDGSRKQSNALCGGTEDFVQMISAASSAVGRGSRPMEDVRQGLRQREPVRKACDEAGVGVEVRPGELGKAPSRPWGQ